MPKAKQRPRFTWYQLSGAPFLILGDADRDLLLRDFASLLATVKHGVLLVRRRLDKFVYRDYAFNVTHYDFYLGAKGSRVCILAVSFLSIGLEPLFFLVDSTTSLARL